MKKFSKNNKRVNKSGGRRDDRGRPRRFNENTKVSSERPRELESGSSDKDKEIKRGRFNRSESEIRGKKTEDYKTDRSYKKNYEHDEPKKSYRTNERDGEEKTYRRGQSSSGRTFKKQDRPYKAGTKPAGIDFNSEKPERSDSFNRQERPYKAGTRPSPGRKYGGRDNEEQRDSGYRKRTGYGNKYDDAGKGSRYENKRDYRDKSGRDKSSDGKVRLNKYIANSGICSRREADELISAGVISVNATIVTEMGFKVSPGDVVKYNDKPVRSEKHVYVLLNKPKDFITTTDDPQNRRTVMNLIQGSGRERIYPVGRLDRATTGVLLFTNDGELTKKLTHPSHEIRKIYQVELDKTFKSSDMDKIKDGIELEDGIAQVDEIFYNGETKKILGIELHSGRNRIVRRIFEALDYRVVKLDRVYFAGLTKKDLSRGRWRFLTEMEISMLKMLTAKKNKRSVD